MGKANMSDRNKKSIRGKTVKLPYGKTSLIHTGLAVRFSFIHAEKHVNT